MANKLLLQGDYPLIASPTLAKAYGLASAVFLQKLHYCLQSSDAKAHDKKRFWFHTLEDWVNTLGLYSVSTIKRVIAKLKQEGVLIIKKLASSKWVQTNYYSIDYKKLQEIFNPQVTEDIPKPPTKVSKEPLPAPVTPEKTIQGSPDPQHAPAAEADLTNYPLNYQRFYKSLRQAKLDISLTDPRLEQWLKHSSKVIRQIYYLRQGSRTPAYWHTPEQLQITQLN
ncbi:hypothetical protein [Acinetobacter dispersus]|uniref:hypothetical protein n=1 Tax=Acinetobacter dispersus TaxID=70348 RepID=UPI00132EFCDA|nr:hypothetical protein [Acinetobacter dispersus]QHH99216.1 hypothetical protein FPL17_17375 [Acinetobacter dispersus]